MGFWMVKSQNWLRLDHLCTGKYILNHSNISFSIRFFEEKKTFSSHWIGKLLGRISYHISNRNLTHSQIKVQLKMLFIEMKLTNYDRAWYCVITVKFEYVSIFHDAEVRSCTYISVSCAMKSLCGRKFNLKKKCNQINEIFVPVKIRMLLICWRHEIST